MNYTTFEDAYNAVLYEQYDVIHAKNKVKRLIRKTLNPIERWKYKQMAKQLDARIDELNRLLTEFSSHLN